MAISVVGTNTGTNTCTVTAHSIGDLILVLAFRTGSNSTPTLPAGYTSLQTVTSNSAGSILAYKIATSTSDTSGTWTNGTNMIISVYTGTDPTTPIGGSAVVTNIGTTVSYPALTMTNATGTSWVAGLGSHRSTNTTIDVAPTGMINRGNSAVAGEISGNDTNGGVSSWSLTTESVGGTSSGWGCYTVELLQAGGGAVNATVAQVAATLTAAGGIQQITGMRTGSPIGLLLALTYNFSTITNATVTQLAATLTAAGGTQVIASVQKVAITQIAGAVTAAGGTQTVSTVNYSTIAQIAGSVTATGGTQSIVAVRKVAIAQIAATVTAQGGTQTVATVNDVAIAQVAATVTATGGTQVLASIRNINIAQIAGSVIATGGTQIIIAASFVNALIAQIAATVMATGGTQRLSTPGVRYWNGSAWISRHIKVWNGFAWVVKPIKKYTGSTWVVLSN